MTDLKQYDHDGFVTTGKRPFRTDSFPMRLFQKAKQFGIWDPQKIDFTQDKQSYEWIPAEFREGIYAILSVFQAGEESVTQDLLPLIMAIAQEGRIEEEMYLTTFLWEEAKHVEFFHRWLSEVAEIDPKILADYHTPSYHDIFYERLPRAMWALKHDPSPKNQLRASITYNMIVEGMLAETGYYVFYHGVELSGQNLNPGLLEGIGKLRQDESRHIAFGVYLISRLLAEHPELWDEAEALMHELYKPARTFIEELLDFQLEKYGFLPFGAEPETFLDYAKGQFDKRFARLEKARHQSLEEIDKIAADTDEDAA